MQVTQSSEIGSTRSLHSSVDWSPTQPQVLALASADSKARLYNVDGKEISTISCSAPVRKLRFSSANNILATSSMDSKVQLWDVRSSGSSSSAITEITLTAPARSMEWNGTYVALTDRARQLYVYDTTVTSAKPILTVPDMGAECVFWYKDYLVMGDDRGQLHVWHSDTFQKDSATKPVWNIPAHSGGIYAGYAHEDDLFVTGGADTTVLFWDAPTMTCIQSSGSAASTTTQQPRRTKYISSIAGRNNRVAVAGPDPSIDVFQSTKLVGTIPTLPLEEVSFNQNGQLLACVKVEPGSVTLHKLSFGPSA